MYGYKFGPVTNQFIFAILANFTYFQIGLFIAWLSPVISLLRNENQTVLPEPLSDREAAWIVSISFLAAGLTLLFPGHVSNIFGTKVTLILLCIPRLIMCILLIFASRVWMLIIGRVLSGLADIAMPVAATYTSEIASKEIRGAAGIISPIMSALSTMLMLSFGPYVSYLTLQIICTCIAIGTFIPLLFLPESPYFLYAKGKKHQCIKVLTFLRGSESSVQEELKEYSLIKDMKFNKKDILYDRVFLKTISIVIIFAFGSQATGYNILILNLQSIFEVTHTSVTPQISSVVSGCVQLFACVCAILLTDRFGRKPLLTFSLIGIGLGMLGLGTFFKLAENAAKITGFLNYLPLISIMLVIYCYNVGLGSMYVAVMAELFDGPARTYGVSVGVLIATALTFIGSNYFYVIMNAIGPAATYWTFSGCCGLCFLFILFCIPETKGKPFSQIQRALGRKAEIASSV